MKPIEVCVMDDQKGPLIVKADPRAAQVRLALTRDDGRLVYVTYARTAACDAEGRPIFKAPAEGRGRMRS